MNFLNEELIAYLEDHCQQEPELLNKLDRETNLKDWLMTAGCILSTAWMEH